MRIIQASQPFRTKITRFNNVQSEQICIELFQSRTCYPTDQLHYGRNDVYLVLNGWWIISQWAFLSK